MKILTRFIKRFLKKPNTPEFLRNQQCSSSEADRLQVQAYKNINRLVHYNNRRIQRGMRPLDFTAEMCRRQGINLSPRKAELETKLHLVAS